MNKADLSKAGISGLADSLTIGGDVDRLVMAGAINVQGDMVVGVPAPTPSRHRSGFVPLPRLPLEHFVGRGDEMALLSDTLEETEPPGVVVLTGTAGVGKSQLATEYAYRQRERYRLVWWVAAEIRSVLIDNFAALADERAVAEDIKGGEYPDPLDLAHAVRTWLEDHDDWLLIFDNAASVEQLSEFLPRGGGGRVLATSRADVNWHPVGHLIPLDVLTPDAGRELLLRRSGDDDMAAAEELADGLGQLPLALEYASGLIANAGTLTLSDYLERYRRQTGFGDRNPLAATWNLSVEQLESSAPEAVVLLRSLAFVAADAIPTWLFLHPPTLEIRLPKGRSFGRFRRSNRTLRVPQFDSVTLAELVAEMRGFGLVKVTGDSLSLHRLLQEVIRDALKPREQPAMARGMLRFLSAVFEAELRTHGISPMVARLLPHFEAVGSHAESLGIQPFEIAAAWTIIGSVRFAQGDLNSAETQIRRAIQLSEGSSGRGPKLIVAHNVLGLTLWRKGDMDAARAEFELCLKLEPALRRYLPDGFAASLHNNLGLVLRDTGDLDGAREQLGAAMELAERASGSEGRDMIRPLSNQAMALLAANDPAGALEAAARAVQIGEAVVAPGALEMVAPRGNLGRALRATGNPDEAIEVLRQTLDRSQGTVADHHPDLITVRSELAASLLANGSYAEAEKELGTALEGALQAFGSEHLTVMHIRFELARALLLQNRGAEADEAIAAALALEEQLNAPTDWKVPYRISLGDAYASIDRLDAARTWFERALQVAEPDSGWEHESTLAAAQRLASHLRRLGEFAAAVNLRRRVYAARAQRQGRNHPDTIDAKEDLATALYSVEDYETAGDLESDVLTWRREHRGNDHPDTIRAADALATLLDTQGQFEAELPLRHEVLAWRREHLGEDHERTIIATQDLAGALRRLGDFTTELPLRQRVLAWRRTRRGDDHPDTVMALEILGATLQASGNLDQARDLLERVFAWRLAHQGDSNPQTIDAAASLAATRRAQGDFAGESALLQRVFAWQREHLGEGHSATLMTADALFRSLAETGEEDTARQLAAESLEWRRTNLGSDHPASVAAASHLASVGEEGGRPSR